MIKLYNKCHFDVVKNIEDKSVNLILTDMPYGITKNKWDILPDLDLMWNEYRRIIKDNGVIVCSGVQPFTSKLILSNPKMFKYEMVWIKTNPSGFLNAKKMPLKNIENILVFYKKQPTYNPQGLVRIDKKRKNDKSKTGENGTGISSHNGGKMKGEYTQKFTNYPRQTLNFSTEKGLHPTQKPLGLMEYLVLTYSNIGDLVFDGFMGSGTTGLACKNLNRDFIGSEIDENMFQVAYNRING